MNTHRPFPKSILRGAVVLALVRYLEFLRAVGWTTQI
jgi:hypothetical protein